MNFIHFIFVSTIELFQNFLFLIVNFIFHFNNLDMANSFT